jgi:hypothetical protein
MYNTSSTFATIPVKITYPLSNIDNERLQEVLVAELIDYSYCHKVFSVSGQNWNCEYGEAIAGHRVVHSDEWFNNQS